MSANSQRSNPIKGIIDDGCDALGLPRPDEFLPDPSEVAHGLGLPTVKEAVPTPEEVGKKALRGKGKLPKPPSLKEIMPGK